MSIRLPLVFFSSRRRALIRLAFSPLLLLIPLGHSRKLGVADFLVHVIRVKSLEKPVQIFVPRQKPVQLPLLPGLLVLRHLCGTAHHRFDELVLVGKRGQTVHLIQHHPLCRTPSTRSRPK